MKTKMLLLARPRETKDLTPKKETLYFGLLDPRQMTMKRLK
ncbi:unnamed protein product [Acidithrix sp. C25]|nr:unnamed protein product [Acidithrix sp. C25]